MINQRPLGLGLIGCGRFGRFCLKAFAEMEEIHPVAAAHVTSAPAARADGELSVPVHARPEELLARSDVDLVHIATPPAGHHRLCLEAIRAGKHVLCEKPLALTVEQADEMIATAAAAGLVLAISFVMRYSPVVEAAKAAIGSGVLGEVLAARATNCASDPGLAADHWFWDKSVSGGIFIEHGVHFFDLYRYWLGRGRLVSAHAERREGTNLEDRATCTVRCQSGSLVSHYHGFDQVAPMDRTDHRLVCEMGDIRVEGWIPVSLEVDAAVDEEGAARLSECCPGGVVEPVETYGPGQGRVMGRGRPRRVTRRIRLRCPPRSDKQAAYADDLRSLLSDQVALIRDPTHVRRVTEADGREALALAEAAAELARPTGAGA